MEKDRRKVGRLFRGKLLTRNSFLKGSRFYFHLYPSDFDENINIDRKEFGFENFDFSPKPIHYRKNKYYLVREIETQVIDVKTINNGLFNTKTRERSNQLSIKNIKLHSKKTKVNYTIPR